MTIGCERSKVHRLELVQFVKSKNGPFGEEGYRMHLHTDDPDAEYSNYNVFVSYEQIEDSGITVNALFTENIEMEFDDEGMIILWFGDGPYSTTYVIDASF